MNNNNWSKTLLTVYRYLGKVSHSFDRMVKTSAENSMRISGDSYSYTNVFDVTNKILDLTERKITLINLKLLIEKVLNKIDRNYARILILKYIDNKTSEQVSEHFGFCTRTFFRKCNLALESFNKVLTRFGYTDEKISKMLENEKWISGVFEDLENQTKNQTNEKQDEFIDDKLKYNIYHELKKIKCFS